jgi:hypothetical protein
MSKQSGLGDNFYIGGYDLSGDVASLDSISGAIGVLDVTPVNKSANVRLYGLRSGDLQFTSYWESTLTVTSPGVPSSTTPYVSTYNFPVLVTVIGGTGTQVAINGVNQGSFDGTYLLPALGTITLTYSVAPTWSWIKVGTEHDALSGLPRSDVVATYFRGAAVGNAAASVLGKQLNYDPTRDSSGNLTLKVEVMGNAYGMEWGTQLTAGIRTDTAATTGAFYDNGAAYNFGAQAYLQILDFVGTSVDVTITHATTSGGSYTTLIDFGAQTGIGSFRQSVSNVTTVNEFLKVATAGTFTYAAFAVMINVNKTAGVVF